MSLFWFLVCVGALLLVPWATLPLWEKRLPRDACPDEVSLITTEDGWTLPLVRYRALDSSPYQHPVILCHGLGVNSVYMDFDSQTSLARTLREAGFDSWVMDLRSSSDRRVQPPVGVSRFDFSFDDLVDYDLPAVMRAVAEKTGSRRIHWVGQSMGGMVALASDPAGVETEDKQENLHFQSLAALGSPSAFSSSTVPLLFLHPLLRWIPALPTRFFTRLGVGPAPYLDFFFAKMQRPGSQTRSAFRYACLHMFAVLPSRLLRHFVVMIREGCLCREDGSRLYEERLRQHSVPGLFLAGDLDGVAPVRSVRHGFERWQGEKEWHLLSPETGTGSFGHGDMVIGTEAPTKVFPRVVKWLQQNEGEVTEVRAARSPGTVDDE